MKLKSQIKQFINFWKKYIEIERNEEKKFHLQEIYNYGRYREKKSRAILNLKGKKLQSFDEMVLVRFGKDDEILEVDIQLGQIVLVVNKEFYKLKKLPFSQFSKAIDSFPIGIVDNIGKKFVDVWMNLPISNWVLKDNVDLHLYVNDITFKRWEEGLDYMLKKRGEGWNYFLKIIFSMDNDFNNLGSEQKILFNNSFINKLNIYQKQFIEKAYDFKSFLLLHGPFGTGKTTTLIGVILNLLQKGYKILVSADSNNAVDNILSRILKQKLIPDQDIVRVGTFSKIYGEEIFQVSIFEKMQTHSKYKKIKDLKIQIEKLKKQQSVFQKPISSVRRGLSDIQILKLAQAGKPYRGLKVKTLQSMANYIKMQSKIDKLIEQINQIRQDIINDIIYNSKIVFTTNSMCFSDILKDKNFDVAIIDEGSQATLPSTLLPILLSDKFIIAGDHKQLPPTVLSNNAKPLEKSLFEFLIDKVGNNDNFYHLLQIQYRMNEKLMDFPNKKFYDGKLKSANFIKDINLKDLVGFKKGEYLNTDKVLYFFDVKGKQVREKDSYSYFNLQEIEFIGNIIYELLDFGIKQKDIGIISPYLAQVNKFKDYIWSGKMLKDIFINTIDGFQGKENQVIIISWVRTDGVGFIIDPRRFNVAITRSQRMLINIGNIANLKKDKLFLEYINYAKNIF